MSQRILVTGATGKIGQEVVKQLTAAGATVRVFVHSLSKAAALKKMGAEVALGDFRQPATLQVALQDVEKLFLLSPMDPCVAEWEGAALQIALLAGVQHIVYLSGMNAQADSPLLFNRLHGQSEVRLKQTGVDYTILRPSDLMQNMFSQASTIRTQGVYYAFWPDTKLAWVDCRDVAAMAVASLVEEGHAGKTYDITGAETLSAYEVVQKLASGLGRPVQCVELQGEQYRAGLKAAGLPDWLVDYLVNAAELAATVKEPPMTAVIEEVVHRPPIKLDQFMRDYAAVFRGEVSP